MLDGDLILHSLFTAQPTYPTTGGTGATAPVPHCYPWRLPLPTTSQPYRFSREKGIEKRGQ